MGHTVNSTPPGMNGAPLDMVQKEK